MSSNSLCSPDFWFLRQKRRDTLGSHIFSRQTSAEKSSYSLSIDGLGRLTHNIRCFPRTRCRDDQDTRFSHVALRGYPKQRRVCHLQVTHQRSIKDSNPLSSKGLVSFSISSTLTSDYNFIRWEHHYRSDEQHWLLAQSS